jgi:ASC-1-like (ASCH) protein
MTKEITLIQHPVIQHSLEEVGKSVTERLASLNIENQVATEDTISALKKMRAELNGEAKVFEDQRKVIKKAILSPYDVFEGIYKAEIIEKYTKADETLKAKISDFEMKIKVEKRNNLQAYFKELAEHEGLDWLSFDSWNVEINLSTTEKKYKEMLLEFVGKVVEDLDLINTEGHAAEIIVEYKKTLNASQSITMVRQRKEQEKLEKERLINTRTNGRIAQLQKISFVYSDIAHAYYFVQDMTVAIPMKDIETLENDEWNKRFVSFEAETAKYAPKAEKVEILQKPTVETKSQEAPKEEIHQAKFCVQGTMSELMKLKEFLVNNNYQYTNI